MAKRKHSARSKAALKGWATRRANARKRSVAALKGWKTRRAREKRENVSKTFELVGAFDSAIERAIGKSGLRSGKNAKPKKVTATKTASIPVRGKRSKSKRKKSKRKKRK